jgi:site-specific DNA recombinase
VRRFFGYTRVSTARQGERGVSLQEQRDAIARYAQRNNLEVVQWFEERVTAAKRGRQIFNQMLRLLRNSKANGVIIHKIDRSARNMKDWAELGELIDQGIEVQFANESLDMHSRGGRLSADIQAVVAADYIRNLREETRKGFYGRIKQGLYPLPAPVGYLDKGTGKPKEPDPVRGPLIKRTFELYATGRYNLDTLGEEIFRLGLRNRRNSRVTRNGLSILLNNPFYIGLIRLQRTGETFAGVHGPLISKSLFDRVQKILEGKTTIRSFRHDYPFRRLITCRHCKYSLIGEWQKGHTYYRCHTKTCPKTCVREETIEQEVAKHFSSLQLNDQERAYADQEIARLRKDWTTQRESMMQSLHLRLSQQNERLNRLTDAYIDRVIDKDIFEARKAALLMERKDIEEKVSRLNQDGRTLADQIAEILELAGSAYLLYESGLSDEKQELLKTITSNRVAEGKNVEFTLTFPFNQIAKREKDTNGRPYRDVPRTFGPVFQSILTWFQSQLQSHNSKP